MTAPCCVDCNAAQHEKNATEEKHLVYSEMVVGEEMSVKVNF